MLPQWLEFNLAHGVDHFFVYTVTGQHHSCKHLQVVVDFFFGDPEGFCSAGLRCPIYVPLKGLSGFCKGNLERT